MDLRLRLGEGGPVLDWGAGPRRCAIGPAGIGTKAGEGDGVTPQGVFAIREIFYRPDRMAKLHVHLPLRATAPDDGWCDAPDDPNYNRLVKLPYGASHEELWREDHLYDLILVLGYNDDPVVPGKGSAIFLHLARPDYAHTHGCVAVKHDDAL